MTWYALADQDVNAALDMQTVSHHAGQKFSASQK